MQICFLLKSLSELRKDWYVRHKLSICKKSDYPLLGPSSMQTTTPEYFTLYVMTYQDSAGILIGKNLVQEYLWRPPWLGSRSERGDSENNPVQRATIQDLAPLRPPPKPPVLAGPCILRRALFPKLQSAPLSRSQSLNQHKTHLSPAAPGLLKEPPLSVEIKGKLRSLETKHRPLPESIILARPSLASYGNHWESKNNFK